MSELEELRQEIQKIKEKNKRVETNKAWEISFTRILLLMTLTYIFTVITLMTFKNDSPWWINALIPALGLYLSTLTLPFVKTFWEKYLYKK